ncbi:MAG: pectinesterase family protein [Prevotella sp.]
MIISSVILTMSALAPCRNAYAQRAPLHTTTGLFDLSNQNTADNIGHYSNQVMIAVTFRLDQGTGGQRASFDSEATAQLFKYDYMEYGSHLNITGKNTVGGSVQTLFQPKVQDGGASELNAIDLMIAPKHGLTFTPTRVSFQATRYGTDGGLLNVEWRSSYTESNQLTAALQPARDNASPAYTAYSYDMTGTKASGSACGLRIYLYNLGETKHIGLGNVVIEGTVSGEVTDATQYTPQLNVLPEGAGTISISPEGTTFETGDRITLTQKRNFGYKFQNWTDGEGNILGKEDQYTYSISDKAANITANYAALKCYELQLSVEGGADESMIELSPKPTMEDGKMMYEEGQRVTLTATNNNLFGFTHWSNGESSDEITLQITQDMALTAHYASTDFIAAWTFAKPGNKNRHADFANSHNQETMLVLQDTEGNSVEWSEDVIQDRFAAVNGHSDKPLGTYYFQTKFNTSGYQDITLSTGMSYNANTYKNQQLEYSLDGTVWTMLTTFTYSSRSRWRTGTYTLPAEANNQQAVWLRWKADSSSEIFGSPTGEMDGAALGETIITGTRIIENDGKAPQMTDCLPTEGADGVPTSGNIVIYFDRPVVANNSVKATLGSLQLTAIVRGSTAILAYKNLDYASSYTFTMPATMLNGNDGQTLPGDITINFTTQSQPKVMKQGYDFIVPDDGSIAEAFKAAMKREDTSQRYRIFVKNGIHVLPRGVDKTYRHTNGKSGDEEVVKFEGTYPDPITYVTGGNISLIGESRNGTVITNDIPADAIFENPPYGYTSVYDGIGQGDVLQISGSGYYFQDITIKSGIPDALGRNLAVHDKASKTIYKNTCLWGYQDTWTSNGSGPYYFEGGQVRGRTDYMCGKGDAFFNGVELLQLRGGYAAVPSQAAKIGWVYKDCVINGGEDGVDGNYTLGRPWGSGTPIALFIDTKMNVKPSPIGWSEMGTGWPKQFAEYNSTDGTGAAVSLAQRKTVFGDGHSNNPVLTADEAATYGNMKNMFGTWDPTASTALPAAPTNVRLYKAENGQQGTYVLSWDDNDYVLGWAVVKDGQVVAFTVSPSYVTTDGKASYAVRAANEMGGLGEAAAAANDTAIDEIKAEKANGSATIYSMQGIRLSKPIKGICIIDGRKVAVNQEMTGR